MTAWSTIADRTAGQTITASWANTLRDNALHLYELVGATGTAFTTSAPTWGGAGLTVGNGTASGGYFTLGGGWRIRFGFEDATPFIGTGSFDSSVFDTGTFWL